MTNRDNFEKTEVRQPAEIFPTISALYKANGAQLFDRSTLLGALVQMPVFGLLYKAISNASASAGPFLWMKSLATPDAALTAIVLLLTALSAYYMPSAAPDKAMLMIVVQVAVTASSSGSCRPAWACTGRRRLS